MSPLKRFKMRPDGVWSKNDVGARITRRSSLSCRLKDASTPVRATVKVRTHVPTPEQMPNMVYKPSQKASVCSSSPGSPDHTDSQMLVPKFDPASKIRNTTK